MGIYKTASGEQAVKNRYQMLLDNWSVVYERHVVKTSFGDTHVISCGNKQHPALVLLHGSGSNSTRWLSEVEEWSKEYYVVAVDLIGEPGFSDAHRADYGSGAYGSWLDEVLANMNLQKIHLVGESLGGWVAMDFAISRVERLMSLSLMCPAGIAPMRSWTLVKTALLMLLGEKGKKRALDIALGRDKDAPETDDSKTIALIWQEYQPRSDRPTIKTDQELAQLSMPVLLIMGDSDAMIDAPTTIDRAQKNITELTLHRLPDVGHLLPSQVATVTGFLKAVS